MAFYAISNRSFQSFLHSLEAPPTPLDSTPLKIARAVCYFFKVTTYLIQYGIDRFLLKKRVGELHIPQMAKADDEELLRLSSSYTDLPNQSVPFCLKVINHHIEQLESTLELENFFESIRTSQCFEALYELSLRALIFSPKSQVFLGSSPQSLPGIQMGPPFFKWIDGYDFRNRPLYRFDPEKIIQEMRQQFQALPLEDKKLIMSSFGKDVKEIPFSQEGKPYAQDLFQKIGQMVSYSLRNNESGNNILKEVLKQAQADWQLLD